MPTFGGIVVATGGQATGRRTLLDVVDELARPVNLADPTIRALAKDAFRAASRRLNAKGCWPWEYQEEDVAIAANSPFSTVTSAIKKPLAMHLLNSSGGTRDERISYEPYEVFIEKYTMDVTGSPPTIYTVPNLFETGQIRWYQIPDAADNARFTFYRVTPAPKNENEALEFPDYVSNMYTAWAWYEFMKRLTSKQRPEDIGSARAEAYLAFREMSAHVSSPGDRSRSVAGWLV